MHRTTRVSLLTQPTTRNIIPECTNLSCGYANEHSSNETLHLPTLVALRDACLNIDWAALPVVRDPTVVER
jgi:hypothetical protein